MDLSHHQSNLSLNFSSSHASPPRRPPIPDDSIALHLESSFRDPSNPVPTVPLQLMEPQTEKENGNAIDIESNNDEDDREVEEFRILGHSMCIKRRRDSESSTITTKRASVESDRGDRPLDLESRKAAVRSWGDQPLQVADPDIYEITEKYKEVGPDLIRHNDTKEASLVKMWTEVESHYYDPAVTPIIYEYFVAPFQGQEPNKSVIESNIEKLKIVLDVYETKLSTTKYLAGDFYSLADLSHISSTHYFMQTPCASMINERIHVKAWWEDISSRTAFQKVVGGMTFGQSDQK